MLADLLPDDAARGSISTLPLAWREPWDTGRADAARRRLDQLAAGLAELQRDTGREVRIAFEPEPGCVVESTGQAAALLSGMDTDRLGVCLDLAHLACAWEEPAEALHRLRTAGLPVVKVQVSAAVEATDPRGGAEALRRWVEPRFLHQTRAPAAPVWPTRRPGVRGRRPGRGAGPGSARPVAGALPRAPARPTRGAARLDPAGPPRGPESALRRAGRRLRPPRRRDVHLGCCRPHDGPAPTRSWPPASPRSWPSPETNWSASA
ncbi:TIM barrel protein [Micromonospora sp. M12]